MAYGKILSLLEDSETIRRKQVSKIKALNDKIHELKKQHRFAIK
jgi:hypothetical protein